MGIISLLLKYFDLIDAPSAVIAFLLLWDCFFGWSVLALQKPVSRDRIHTQLLRKKPATVYRDIMAPRLAALSRWLTPQTVEDHPRPSGLGKLIFWLTTPRAPDAHSAKAVAEAPFSWPVFDAALLLAVIYPFAALAVQWSIQGEDTRIGTFVAIYAERDPVMRIGVVIAAALTLMLSRGYLKELRSGRDNNLRQLIWLAPIMPALFLGGNMMAQGFFVLAGGILAAFAFGGAGAGATAVAMAGAIAAGIALAEPEMNNANATLTFLPFAQMSALVGLGYLVSILLAWRIRKGAGTGAYWGFCISLLLAFVALATTGLLNSAMDQAIVLFLFIGLLALINGVFDYLSYGITLTLIRVGLKSGNAKAALLGIVDAVIALTLFTALGVTILLVLGLIQRISGTALLPLGPLFSDLRLDAARWDYLWLFGMMFSTALPTLIHFCLATLSLQGFYPLRWRTALARMIEKTPGDDETEAMDALERDQRVWGIYHLSVSLMWTLSLALPALLLGGLGYALWHLADNLGCGYLYIFEWVAWTTDQIPEISYCPKPGT